MPLAATTETALMMWEIGAYIACALLTLISLLILVGFARREMRPRRQYTRADPTFTDVAKGQNWSWDWIFVFAVRRDDTKGLPLLEDARSGLVGCLRRCLDSPDARRRFLVRDAEILEQYTLRRCVESLEAAGLETKIFRSLDRSFMFVKIRADARRLRDEAARTEYKLLLDGGEIQRRIRRGYRDEFGNWRWYPRRKGFVLRSEVGGRIVEKHFDTQIEDTKGQSPYAYYDFIYGPFLAVPHGESKIKKVDDHLSKKEDDEEEKDIEEEALTIYQKDRVSNSIFRTVDRIKLIQSIIEADSKTAGGASLNLKKLCARPHALVAAYPLHSLAELTALQDTWLNSGEMPWRQPISGIRDYFGEKIALYFVFLGSYTTWLFFLAVLGISITVIQFLQPRGVVIASACFAIFVSLWATFFTAAWHATQSTYVMMWGTTDFESFEQPRPEFDGKRIHSPITGFPAIYFSPRAKRRRYCLSYLVVVVLLIAAALIHAGAFVMQAYIANRPIATQLGDAFALVSSPSRTFAMSSGRRIGLIFSHLVIATTSYFGVDLFKPIGEYLNTLENHRTETQYEDNLIAKGFIFRFVVAYGPLFYIAVLQKIFAEQIFHSRRADCVYDSCFNDLSHLLVTIFIFRVLVGNISQVAIPLLRRRRRRPKVKDDGEFLDPYDPATARVRQTSQVEEQFLLDDYHHLLGTFDDFADMITQFGYVSLFATAFPLAPFFAFVTNFVEIRIDAWKLCQNTRRAWPMSAEDIGTWEKVLAFMTVLATMTNSWLVIYTSVAFEDFTTFERFLLFTAMEYLLLGVYIVVVIVRGGTEKPPDVALQLERQDFLVSKILLNVDDEEKDIADDDDEAMLDDDQKAQRRYELTTRIVVHTSDPGVGGASSQQQQQQQQGQDLRKTA